ncbi:hypothetical protein 13VV501A_gene0024 [Vibrio phage 13VV501A]|nr:hypothetical protein 13VV501A_gene0024 [Vibrio phage 13VV501A]
MRFDGKTTKRRVTKYAFNELSSVKTGAASTAKATILKISADNLEELLEAALGDKFPKPSNASGDAKLKVKDYDGAYLVFEDYDGAKYAHGFSFSEGVVTLLGERIKVVEQEYFVARDTGDTFFKSATDAYMVSKLDLCGFEPDQSLALAKAIDTEQPVDAQIAALALQFGKACDNIPDVSNTVTTGDADMSDTKTPEQLQKELDAQTARVAELEVLAKMCDDEKSYMSKMSEEDKKKWMAMTTEERKAKMKTEKAADEQYTMTDGQVIAKSAVGDTAFAFMKAQDQRIAKMEEDRQQSEALELVKALCPNLPGTPEAMAGAIRKCRNSLTTEEFSVIEKALKAGDEAMKARTVAKAHDKPVGNADAQKVFDDAIAKIANDKRISKSAAYSTPEGLEAASAFRSATEGDE